MAFGKDKPDPAVTEAVSNSDMALYLRRKRKELQFIELGQATVARLNQADAELAAAKAQTKKIDAQVLADYNQALKDIQVDKKKHQIDAAETKKAILIEISEVEKAVSARKALAEAERDAAEKEAGEAKIELAAIKADIAASPARRRTVVADNKKQAAESSKSLAAVDVPVVPRQVE